MSDAFVTPPDSNVRRKRLAAQVLLWTAGLVPVIAGVGLWIITRSWFIILITAPGLEQKLGGTVRIGEASYHGNGRLVYEDLILYCPGLEGPGSQVVRIARAEVIILPATLLSGVTITDVRLDGILLRLSEDRRESGAFNFELLEPNWEGSAALPPTVRIDSAVIEVGSHAEGHYRPIGQRRVAGEMYAAGNGAWYEFRLQELDENGESLGSYGLSIDGSWDVETMEPRASSGRIIRPAEEAGAPLLEFHEMVERSRKQPTGQQSKMWLVAHDRQRVILTLFLHPAQDVLSDTRRREPFHLVL